MGGHVACVGFTLLGNNFMATVNDLRLMNEAFGGLANTIMQQREMQERRKERDAALKNQATNQAMMNEYRMASEKQREKSEADTADWRTQMLQANKDKQGDAAAGARMKNKIGMFHAIAALNTTGDLSDAGRKEFNDWLSNDDDFGSTGIQLQAPNNPKNAKKASALEATVAAIKNYRDMAANATGDDAKDFNHYADLLESNLPENVKKTSAPKPTRTSVTSGTSPAGNLFSETNTVSYGDAPVMPGQEPAKKDKDKDPLGIFQ